MDRSETWRNRPRGNMPLYEFSCQTCGKRESVINSVANRDSTPPQCGDGCDWMRIITSSKVIGDIEAYVDENIAPEPVVVKSRQHREKLMRKHGVYEKYGKGWL